ncbi:MAG: TonB-dependent receptor [Reichenbachiella sp.]
MSQKIGGLVMNQNQEVLIGAMVKEMGTNNGSITDIHGRFDLELANDSSLLIISYIGYESDTIQVKVNTSLRIILRESTEQLSEVTISAAGTFIDQVAPIHTEFISEAELTKAACCNLSESFETNASVDVSFSDAVTGAKTIRMLGLDGRYVQINRENMPHIRGLSSRYGMSFVPGTWIQSIDLGKGAGSVVNGYESMTGQINLELKKPSSEKLFLNTYLNSFGRMEVNLNIAQELGAKWKTAFLLHSNFFNNEIEGNDDGFMDVPKSKQINLLNRYELHTEKLHSQIGISFMIDEKAGGQLGFGFGSNSETSSLYGFISNTKRIEVFGKTGLLFPQKPYKGWGFIYSGSYLDIEGGYGRNNYDGTETTFYGNVIFQNIIGNTFHQYKTGVSILYDDLKENFADSTFNRQEIVPGLFYEYSFIPSDDLTIVAGLRSDFHNLYGTYFTPRLHVKYQISPGVTTRGAIGRGYRTPNVIMENSQVLVSSRQLIIQEAPNPEVSWNMGGSVTTEIPIGDRKMILTGDYFYTHFQNQLIYDMDQNSSELNVYNLNGQSFAHSFQIEGNYVILKRLNLKAAYKYYNVQSTIGGVLQQVPFASKHRVFANMGYETKFEKWQFDVTMQWFGAKRLPNTSDKPVEFQRPEFSPDFFLMNGQVSRNFRWGSIYLGGENLLNFKQTDPIIDAENPFGNNFDASIVWAPIAGRVVYAGFRFKLKE